jgi:hypothetical protein
MPCHRIGCSAGHARKLKAAGAITANERALHDIDNHNTAYLDHEIGAIT